MHFSSTLETESDQVLHLFVSTDLVDTRSARGGGLNCHQNIIVYAFTTETWRAPRAMLSLLSFFLLCPPTPPTSLIVLLLPLVLLLLLLPMLLRLLLRRLGDQSTWEEVLPCDGQCSNEHTSKSTPSNIPAVFSDRIPVDVTVESQSLHCTNTPYGHSGTVFV